MKKEKKIELTQNPKIKLPNFSFRTLITMWIIVLMVLIAIFIISQSGPDLLKPATYQILALIVSFSSLLITSLFSMAIFRHNANIREMNERNQRMNDDLNARAESFRTLQFVASNYSVVDFIDYMLIYETYDKYKNKLLNEKDLTLYMRETNLSNNNEIFENFNDIRVLTVRMPMKIVVGKEINLIRFSRFEFSKEDCKYHFVPCCSANKSLIIYNEAEKRPEIVINLIVKKSSDFYTSNQVIPFLKIKMDLTMQSLLGVSVSGRTELYFTNPLKLEKSGANKYKIESSQFRVSGLPTLINSVGEDIKNLE